LEKATPAFESKPVTRSVSFEPQEVLDSLTYPMTVNTVALASIHKPVVGSPPTFRGSAWAVEEKSIPDKHGSTAGIPPA
jgi:hypothetical protein